MPEEVRSVLAWGTVFFAVELPAHFKLGRLPTAAVLLAAVGVVIWLWPVLTLSRTGWTGIAWWSFVGALIAIFTFALLAHLELHWSARWLIAITLGSAAVIVSHVLEKATR